MSDHSNYFLDQTILKAIWHTFVNRYTFLAYDKYLRKEICLSWYFKFSSIDMKI